MPTDTLLDLLLLSDDCEAMIERSTTPESDLQFLVRTQVLDREQNFIDLKYVVNYDMPRFIHDHVQHIGGLLSAADAVDQGLLISYMLYELAYGPMSASAVRRRRESWEFLPVYLVVNAKSVHDALTASLLKKTHA